MRAHAGVFAVVLGLAAMMGCEEPQERSRVGVVAQPGDALRVGDRAPSFDFYDSSGKRVRFGNIRGDITILTIEGKQDPDTCSVAGNVLMLAEKYSSVKTNVTYVCVSEPAGGACDLKSNVAEKCGIYDSNYFTRLFKKIQGSAPRDFRRS